MQHKEEKDVIYEPALVLPSIGDSWKDAVSSSDIDIRYVYVLLSCNDALCKDTEWSSANVILQTWEGPCRGSVAHIQWTALQPPSVN